VPAENAVQGSATSVTACQNGRKRSSLARRLDLKLRYRSSRLRHDFGLLQGSHQPLDRWPVGWFHDASQSDQKVSPGIPLSAPARFGHAQTVLDLVAAAELDELISALPTGLELMLALVLAAIADQFLDALGPETPRRRAGRIHGSDGLNRIHRRMRKWLRGDSSINRVNNIDDTIAYPHIGVILVHGQLLLRFPAGAIGSRRVLS